MINHRPGDHKVVNENKQMLFNNRILETKSYWTIDDLMAFTGLAKQTIYNKVANGKIPYRKQWGKLFFDPIEILNLIEEGE